MVRFRSRIGKGVDEETLEVGLRLKRENAMLMDENYDISNLNSIWVWDEGRCVQSKGSRPTNHMSS